MSDATLAALLAALPQTLIALATLVTATVGAILGILAHRRGRRVEKEGKDTNATAKALVVQGEEIKAQNTDLVVQGEKIQEQTNGNLQQLRADLKLAYAEIAELKQMAARRRAGDPS